MKSLIPDDNKFILWINTKRAIARIKSYKNGFKRRFKLPHKWINHRDIFNCEYKYHFTKRVNRK